MRKVKVLFLTADPRSAYEGEQRLLLDEDMRQILEKVRAADHRDALEFVFRPAARTDDLLQALNEVRPRVVHFSGHGESEGLVLVSADGLRSHLVEGEVLEQLFRQFRDDVRLVVLNACFSLPQAKAIANAVGCAIGTRGGILDDAAIRFDAAFYRAVAFGHSVWAAFDQAVVALRMEHFDEANTPELVVRDGMDPAQLVLVSPNPAVGGEREPDAGPTALPPEPLARTSPAPGPSADNGRPVLARAHGASPGLARGGRRRAAAGAILLVTALTGYIVVEPRLRASRSSADPGGPAHAQADSLRVARDTVPRVAFRLPGSIPRNPPLQAPPADTAPAPSAGPAVPASELATARAQYARRDYRSSFPVFERAAAAGDADAMAYLGSMYLRGDGTARDPDVAVRWLRRAADAGSARGMNALGFAYQTGDGVERDYGEAMRLYTAAQDKGFAWAMNNIGTLYRQGWGVDRNYAEALLWYRRAATAGLPDAMTNAGAMYEEGLGVERDLDEARRWYRSAADAGFPWGMYMLGKLAQTTRDYTQARDWYLRAADGGVAAAMNNLGKLYYEGWGVPRNRAEAIRWFRRAADAGSHEAASNLISLGEAR